MENELSRVVDALPGLVWTARPDGHIDFLNQRWCDYTGLGVDEAYGRGWQTAIHPEDLPELLKRWQSILASGEPSETEARLRRFDGEYRWFLFRTCPLADASGAVVKWCGMNTDIEDRRRSEETQRAHWWLSSSAREHHFRSVGDDIPGPAYLITPAGEVEIVNRQVLEYFGATLEELKGRAIADTVHPDDRADVVAAWRRAVETGHPYDVEARLRRADGIYRWFHTHGFPLRDTDGRIVLWYLLQTDVDDRRQAEERLRQSEAYLSEAQRLSHTGSFGWSVATGEIIWSEETFRIFQFDRTTKPTVELIVQRTHPEDRPLAQRTIERASQDGKDFDFEHRLLMPDASIKHLHVIGHAERNKCGEFEFVGAVMEVTVAKDAEERIRQNERELRTTLEAIPASVTSARPDGSVDFVSQSWLDYVGYSREETLGWGWTTTIHPEDLDRVLNNWQAASAAGEPVEIELRHRRPDGKYRWFLARAVPLRDEKRNIVKWYATTFDIDDRKRTEALLAGQKRVLEMVAKGDALPRILDALCRVVEEHSSDILSSFLLLDANGTHLRHGAAPRLPQSYIDAIDGVAIGPTGGACITAAYRAAPVVVSDIASDPLWAAYRDLPLAHGLRACWSTPIISSEGKVLGTFAMYFREPRNPSPQDLHLLEQVASLAAVAIKHKQAEESLRRSEAYLAESQRLTHTVSCARTVATEQITHSSEEHSRLYGFDPEEGVPSFEALYQRVHPEDRARGFETYDRAVGEQTDFEVDYRTVLPDGTIKYLHAIGHPVFNAAGDLVEYMGTVMDVTERKRAEEALRASEQVARGQVEALAQNLDILATAPAPQNLIGQMLSTIGRVLNAQSVALWLLAEPNGSLVFRAAAGGENLGE